MAKMLKYYKNTTCKGEKNQFYKIAKQVIHLIEKIYTHTHTHNLREKYLQNFI